MTNTNKDKVKRGDKVFISRNGSVNGGSSIFDDIVNFDFGISFGTINYTITLGINENGDYYTNLYIKDRYEFFMKHSDGDPIENFNNSLAYYYQEIGKGKPFTWELNITETH